MTFFAMQQEYAWKERTFVRGSLSMENALEIFQKSGLRSRKQRFTHNNVNNIFF